MKLLLIFLSVYILDYLMWSVNKVIVGRFFFVKIVYVMNNIKYNVMKIIKLYIIKGIWFYKILI